MKYLFSGHAVRQMFSRNIIKNDVLYIIEHGEIIIKYPDDKPYPSQLMLGFIKGIPLHVVFAIDKEQNIGIIVTTYIPDPKLWSGDFKSRRSE